LLLTASIVFTPLLFGSRPRGSARFISFLPVGVAGRPFYETAESADGLWANYLMMGIRGWPPPGDTLHVHTRSFPGTLFSFSFGLIMSYIGQTLSGDVEFTQLAPTNLAWATGGVGACHFPFPFSASTCSLALSHLASGKCWFWPAGVLYYLYSLVGRQKHGGRSEIKVEWPLGYRELEFVANIHKLIQ